jgi:hypothetical protein
MTRFEEQLKQALTRQNPPHGLQRSSAYRRGGTARPKLDRRVAMVGSMGALLATRPSARRLAGAERGRDLSGTSTQRARGSG